MTTERPAAGETPERDMTDGRDEAHKTAANEHGRTPQRKHGPGQERTLAQKRAQRPQADTRIQGRESLEGAARGQKPEFAERCVSRLPG